MHVLYVSLVRAYLLVAYLLNHPRVPGPLYLSCQLHCVVVPDSSLGRWPLGSLPFFPPFCRSLLCSTDRILRPAHLTLNTFFPTTFIYNRGIRVHSPQLIYYLQQLVPSEELKPYAKTLLQRTNAFLYTGYTRYSYGVGMCTCSSLPVSKGPKG